MMNNKDDYKKMMDQIHAPEELKQKTFEKMNKKQINFVPLKLLSAVAVVMIVFVLGQNYFKNGKDIVYTEKPDSKKEIEVSDANTDLPRFKDKQELLDMIKESSNGGLTYGARSMINSTGMVDGAVEESATMDTAKSTTGSANQGDFSKTNNQVDSVDEADVVKTDGKHIFYTSNGIVNIIDANSLELLAEIRGIRSNDETFTPFQLFLNGNKLVILGNYSKAEKVEEREDQEEVLYDYAYINYHEMTKAMVYDLSNINEPQLVREVALDGFFKSARMIEDNVYFISNKGVYFYRNIDELEDEDLLPVVNDSIALGEEKRIDYTNIAYFPGATSYSYLLVGGFNLNNNEPLSVEAFFGAGDTVYCSENNLYLTQIKYDKDYSRSNIMIYKFELENGKVSMKAKGEVEGRINDQFSLDEFEGNLRIAATVVVKPYSYNSFWGIYSEEETTNRVYILDENLNELSRVDNMADGEKIYAVRFMGKIGYVVTFEQIDPLFVLDLSDPKNPEIKGELKIPGYSSYLHPYDETHVIGIGYNTKDNGYGGVTNANMKMSMFDISDLNNPREMFSTSIGLAYAYSDITYDHKALFYKASDNLIGFSYNTYDEEYTKDYWAFDIYHIDLEKGFEKFARFAQKDNYETNIRRMIYIGDTVYGLSEKKVTSYNLNTQELLHELDLNTLYDDDMFYIYKNNMSVDTIE